jgi:hypothetical protein
MQKPLRLPAAERAPETCCEVFRARRAVAQESLEDTVRLLYLSF